MRAAIRRFRSFPAPARAFLAGAALLEIGHAFLWALQNLYVVSLPGRTVADVSYVNVASATGVVSATIPSAWLYERLGPRRSLSLACVLNVTAIAGLALSSSLPALLFWAALSGAAYTLHTVVNAPYLVSVSEPGQRTPLFQAEFAVHTFVQTGGLLLSCLLAGMLETGAAPLQALRGALLAGAALSLLALLPYRRVPAQVVDRADDPARSPLAILGILGPRHWHLWLRVSLPYFFIGVGAGLSIPFINLYFTDRFSVSKPVLGLVMAAACATMTFGALATTRLVPRLGLVRATILTQALSIPFFLALALATSLPLAIAAYVMRSALMNLATPLWRNLAMEVTPPLWRAAVNGTAMLCWNVGWALSTLWGGMLIDRSAGWLGEGRDGFVLPMLLTIGIYLVAITLEALLFWRHRDIGLASGPGPLLRPATSREPQPPRVLAAETAAEDPALRA